MCDLTLRTGRWWHVKEGATETRRLSTSPFFVRVFSFDWVTCHMYSPRGDCPPPLRKTEKGENKAAREELGRQGRLSNRQAGCPTWSRNCECDRYRADVDDWCTGTNSEPPLSLLPDYHNSLIHVSTHASKKNVLHQHCAAGSCLSLSLWLHYGT